MFTRVIAAGRWIRATCLVGSLIASSPLPAADVDDPPTLVFAGSADYPPFQWRDADGEARGFVIDLQDAIAARGGRTADHRLMDWRDALHAVESGKADGVALFASDRRRERFSFTEPFYYVAHAIFSAADGEGFGRLESLRGHTVAVVQGAYAEQRLLERGDDLRLLATPNELACLEAVVAGAASACIEATHTARHNAAAAGLDVLQTSVPFWPRPYVFGVKKGNTELLDWLNRQLALVQIEGTYHRLYNEWLSQLEWHEPTLADTLRRLAWLMLPLLLMASAGYVWSWSLRRRVAEKTSHLALELEHRKKLEKELHHRAHHDALTGLPNRGAFVETVQKLIDARPDRRPTLMALRVVNREQLITTFSYDVIQDLMKALARRLKSLDLEQVGHFGSGVFAIVPKTAIDGDALIRLVNDPLELERLDLDPQFVVGMVAGDSDDDGPVDVDELIRRAITAMSAARQRGLQWLAYSRDLEPDPADLLLLQDFHRHSTRDMFLLYQPKVDLQTGRINAAEALIRWRHPTLGVLLPERFIPLLEHSGLIHRVTRWVAEEATSMMMRMGSNDLNYSISINIAPQDLLESDLVAFLTGMGKRMNRNCLNLEITETGFIADPLHARDVLTGLCELGTRCAVDDFGTGYSSLSYLSEFPVDEVKLDRQFVSDMLQNPYHQVIVRSTITLAHELGLTVTAEGVEDRRTLQALARMGCDAAQGFLICEPVSEKEVRELLGCDVDRIKGQVLLGDQRAEAR